MENTQEISIKGLSRQYKKLNVERTFQKLLRCEGSFYIRRGSECNELIYDNKHRVFTTETRNFPATKIFLFNSVQVDVRKFLKSYPFVELPPLKPVSEYNYEYDDTIGTITGTDLDHAFWRIAHIKGYISKRTYNYGLDEDAKALRLATLSVLGREKRFEKYVHGKKVDDVILKKRDPQLQLVYKDIRYSSYYMMYELSRLLGEDFESWKTDCIYYRDSPENRALVHKYFADKQMLFKQLSY